MLVALPGEQTNRIQAAFEVNAVVSVNIPGWTVEPLGPHEPCRMDGTVDSTIILQSPASPARSAASPIWMETKVSDVIVSIIPGGPEFGCPRLRTIATVRTSPLLRSTLPSETMHPYVLGWGATCNDTSTGDTGGGGGSTIHQLFGTKGSYFSFEGFHESRHAPTISHIISFWKWTMQPPPSM